MPILAPLVALTLLFLSGCRETQAPSLLASDFFYALKDEGYEPQKTGKPSDFIAVESEPHLRS